jgi:hypothetical protein
MAEEDVIAVFLEVAEAFGEAQAFVSHTSENWLDG